MEPKKLKSVRLKRALKKFNDSPEKKSGNKEESESVYPTMDCDQETSKRTRLANIPAPKQSTENKGKARQGRTAKGSRGRGRGKGKAPAKKAQTQRKPVYKTEVNLSESSSDDDSNAMADEDDDVLANIDYESWQK